jgi:hypothetical protein
MGRPYVSRAFRGRMSDMDAATTAQRERPTHHKSRRAATKTLMIDAATCDRALAVAEATDRSLSWIARAALREWLDRHHPAAK